MQSIAAPQLPAGPLRWKDTGYKSEEHTKAEVVAFGEPASRSFPSLSGPGCWKGTHSFTGVSLSAFMASAHFSHSLGK